MLPMKTTIIVPTYNRPALIGRMLDSLRECEFPPNVEILIVENGKRTKTQEICKENSLGGRVRYIFVEKAGRSVALNIGIKQSDAEFLIFFDDDLTFAPDIIGLYVAAAKKYGPRHFFGGPLIADAESTCLPHLIPHLPSSCKDWSMPNDESQISLTDEVMFFGANWAGFRSDLLDFGGYSEDIGVSASRYSPVGEETLMQQNMLKAGLIGIYLQGALIYHLVPKECYTEKWIRNRKMRHGITDYILDMQKTNRVKTVFRIPIWVLPALGKEFIKALGAALKFEPVQRRTAISMRISYLLGMLYGAFLHRII